MPPGVLVQLPVLGPQDVQDVQDFAAKHGMDLVAASFVQSADDVRFIRKTLDEAGGQHIKIISKVCCLAVKVLCCYFGYAYIYATMGRWSGLEIS